MKLEVISREPETRRSDAFQRATALRHIEHENSIAGELSGSPTRTIDASDVG